MQMGGAPVGVDVTSGLGLAVARKALDAQKVEGRAAVQLIDGASRVASAPVPPPVVTPTRDDVTV
jgi:hypothetical protein